jgi:hypothetical protein
MQCLASLCAVCAYVRYACCKGRDKTWFVAELTRRCERRAHLDDVSESSAARTHTRARTCMRTRRIVRRENVEVTADCAAGWLTVEQASTHAQ